LGANRKTLLTSRLTGFGPEADFRPTPVELAKRNTAREACDACREGPMAQEPDPFDVEALERSLNDSATRVSTIWISFLGFALYLVVAAGSVTHRQLFLEDPIKLPALNVDLPLVGFFFLTPILLLLFHAYVLIQILLLGRTAATYNDVLDRTVRTSSDNAAMRQRLANTLFAQIFAGSPRERRGLLGGLLRMIAWLTLAIAPVLVLLLFQFKFLPYHSPLITWTIRLVIVLDLIAVLVLWRAARRPDHELSWRFTLQGWMAWLCAAALAVFSWVALTFPGEPHAQWTRFESRAQTGLWQYTDRWDGRPPECQSPSPLHRAFFRFDRLSLPDVDVVDPEQLAKMKPRSERIYAPSEQKHTHSFRRRDLTCADLSRADLRRVDLSYAQFRGAQLVGADLEDADLAGANLEGAKLNHATLNDASLFLANLGNASLESAQLMRANLGSTWLTGASLKEAMLYGANLDNAQAQGADLSQARLEGAVLRATQLQGASLKASYLQFALLVAANLQGADLRGAELDAARLDSVGLQGADLSESAMTHARLSWILVWRAKNASCTNASIDHHAPDALVPLIPDALSLHSSRGTLPTIPETVPATRDKIKNFIENSVAGISIAKRRQAAIDRMQSGLVPSAQDDTAEIEAVWHKCAEISQHSKTEFENGRVASLGALFCATKTRVCVRDLYCDAKRSVNAVAEALLGPGFPDPASRSSRFAQLAQGMLGKDKPCAASGELDERNKERLRAAAGDPQ
jgi:uncharacterized protein YjbI with pentapeptide repeats